MSWERIRGHDEQVRAFERVIRGGRLAHAYLFTGPAGVGKRLFAEELAKALLCEGRRAGRLEACDQCEACALFASGTHPDYFRAGKPEDALELPIEIVRELCRGLSLKPARGQRKIAVLDDADHLNEYAANCFLKTLEEPPPGSVLILIGTSSDRQLPTILSRCQVVRLTPLSEADVVDILNSHGLPDPALIPGLARLGRGSPGEALALAEPELWEFRKRLLDTLSLAEIDRVAVAGDWTRFVEEAGKDSAAQRRRASQSLRLLIEFLRDVVWVKSGGMPRLTAPEDLRNVQQMAQRTDLDRLERLIERCLEADLQIERRLQLALVLEALVDCFGAAEPVKADAG